MGRTGLFDLERHFTFYSAYHNNLVNILIHTVFVWPIFFTSLVLLYFTSSLYTFPAGLSHDFLLNFGFVFTVICALFYVCLDKKAGSLAALLCVLCWVGASLLAGRLGFSLELPSKADMISSLSISDAGALGPGGLADVGVEEVAPVFAVVVLEGGLVVLDVEEDAGVGLVDDLIKRVGLGVGGGSRGRVGVEGDVVGREIMGVGCVVVASFVATVAAMEDCG
ncbi:unnamed protein product [Prunus armeniaca]|uniref:Uncharacterized protein n=1 Tax=Prunus armeniaca TaxID=36596 RepID=A0A6J5V6S0_PRUAR|nr:unnamed protein product [Prunus armeniaca]